MKIETIKSRLPQWALIVTITAATANTVAPIQSVRLESGMKHLLSSGTTLGHATFFQPEP